MKSEGAEGREGAKRVEAFSDRVIALSWCLAKSPLDRLFAA
jgi:hypothetical protein